MLALTPAYDICPQGRSEYEASQAMKIDGSNNLSQLKTCVKVAHHFLLSTAQAHSIIELQKIAIETHWHAVCDSAELNQVDRAFLMGRQFFNPFALEGLEERSI
jgi:serine/threonine-protein kinase HipA